MSFRTRTAFAFFVSLAALSACTNDDTGLNVRAQARVNQAVTSESDIEVHVSDGVVTLTGVASSDAMHARAVAAARSVEGVRGLVDRISTPGSLTGGTVPR